MEIDWKKVIVFEAFPKGHRLHFAGVVAKALAQLGASPILTLPEYIRGTEQEQVFLSGLAESYSNIETKYFEMPDDGTNNYRLAAQNIFKIIREEDPFRLYLPTADGIAQTIGLRSLTIPAKYRRKIEAIVFRGPFAYPTAGLQSRIRNMVIRKLVSAAGFGVTHRVDPISHFCISPGERKKYRESLLPEPIESEYEVVDRAEACLRLGLNPDDKHIIALGQLDPRKGIDVLIRAFIAADIPDDVKLVLAGRQDAAITAELEKVDPESANRIVIRNTVIPQDEFDLMLNASNWLAVTYPRHIGSSGILLRANQFQRPVIASDFGWVGWATRTFGLGVTCNAKEVTSVKEAILKVVHENVTYVSNEANQSLARFHTEENFGRYLLKEYCMAHDSFDENEMIDWASVEETISVDNRLA